MAWHLDWAGVLTGQPWQWILSGLAATLYVTLLASLLATLIALLMLGLRLAPGRAGHALVAAYVAVFRNTPLLVQLLFWYFAAWSALPQRLRFYIGDMHPWSVLPGNVPWLAPEFLCACWGLALFCAAFLIEEVQAGLNSVPAGQKEAALSQGFSQGQMLRHVLLPQGLLNAWQPLVGQYLNLMKLSSLASGISFAELTYQVGHVESYNAHALEGFAVGTALYLLLGVAMGSLLMLSGPKRRGGRQRLVAAVDAATQPAVRGKGVRHDL
ncbi:amino acid ABC transporter permease [Acerihabitans arboris]|uniref:ABC transporter permease subunit n=1 Tax=Acerihabitans arboris TaxID=2691583 RepID=A0A845SGU3_9GAMM|nr:amino acid ABC transporter permease [Acerihabitans arboris]NDL61851.1 ABC transporter permease subunit [Acerihabitans arboris]